MAGEHQLHSDDTEGLHGGLRPQAAEEAGSEAYPQLLVKHKTYDGVGSGLGEAHPHSGRQVELRHRAVAHKYPQEAGAHVRSPHDEEGQGDHVVHLPDALLHLKLVQHQQPSVAEVRSLSDAHQRGRGGSAAEARDPVGGRLPGGSGAVEGPVLADSRDQLSRLHFAVVVNEAEHLDVDDVRHEDDDGEHQHEAHRVVRLHVAVLEDALLLFADELVGAHVEHRGESHRDGEGPHHADHRGARTQVHPLVVEPVVGDRHVPGDADAEQQEGDVEAEEHRHEGDQLAAERAVRPGGAAADRCHHEGEAHSRAQHVRQAQVQQEIVRSLVQRAVLQQQQRQRRVAQQADAHDQTQGGQLDRRGRGRVVVEGRAAPTELACVRHLRGRVRARHPHQFTQEREDAAASLDATPPLILPDALRSAQKTKGIILHFFFFFLSFISDADSVGNVVLPRLHTSGEEKQLDVGSEDIGSAEKKNKKKTSAQKTPFAPMAEVSCLEEEKKTDGAHLRICGLISGNYNCLSALQRAPELVGQAERRSEARRGGSAGAAHRCVCGARPPDAGGSVLV